MSNVFSQIIEYLLTTGHTELAAKLRELEPTDPIQGLLLKAISSAVQKHGLEGVQLIKDQLVQSLAGDVVDLSGVKDTRVRSDMLAALQQLEADKKSELRAWIEKVVNALAPVVAGLLGMIVK